MNGHNIYDSKLIDLYAVTRTGNTWMFDRTHHPRLQGEKNGSVSFETTVELLVCLLSFAGCLPAKTRYGQPQVEMLMVAMMFVDMLFLLAGFIRCSFTYQRQMWRQTSFSDNIEATESPSETIRHIGKVAVKLPRFVNVVLLCI